MKTEMIRMKVRVTKKPQRQTRPKWPAAAAHARTGPMRLLRDGRRWSATCSPRWFVIAPPRLRSNRTMPPRLRLPPPMRAHTSASRCLCWRATPCGTSSAFVLVFSCAALIVLCSAPACAARPLAPPAGADPAEPQNAPLAFDRSKMALLGYRAVPRMPLFAAKQPPPPAASAAPAEALGLAGYGSDSD